MDKEGAMALTYKEDDSRSGKRAAIYRGVAEQVGHGISRSREIRGVTDRGQGSGMKTQNRTGIENSLRGGGADIGHTEHGQSELAARLRGGRGTNNGHDPGNENETRCRRVGTYSARSPEPRSGQGLKGGDRDYHSGGQSMTSYSHR